MTRSRMFDPYHRWLGIPPEDQPPNHYRLFGVKVFESDADVIDAVSLRHIEYLQQIQEGPHIREAQRLLNELVAARRCLLDANRKQAYDQRLRAELQPQIAAERPAKPPRKQPPVPTPPPPVAEPDSDSPTPRRIREHSDVSQNTTRSRIREHSDPPPSPSKTSRLRLPRSPATLAVSAIAVLAAVACGIAWLAGGNAGEPDPTGRRSPRAFAELARSVQDTMDSPLPSAARDESPEPAASGVPQAALQPAEPGAGTGGSVPVPPPEPEVPFATGDLLLWLDAAGLPPGGGPLDLWPDRSPRAWEVGQESPPERPVAVPGGLNGRPLVRFSGAQWLEISGSRYDLDPAAGYTIAFVARGRKGVLLSKGAMSGRTRGWTLPLDLVVGGPSAGLVGNPPAPAAAGDSLPCRVGTVVVRGEGSAWFADGQLVAAEPPAEPFSRICNARIGCAYFRDDAGDARFFHGELAELLAFDRPLDDESRWQVERYLREKWLPECELAQAPTPRDAALQLEGSSGGATRGGADEGTDDSGTAAMPEAAGSAGGTASAAVSAVSVTPAATRSVFGTPLPLASTGSIHHELWEDFHGDGAADVRAFAVSHPDPDRQATRKELAAPEDQDDDFCQRLWGWLQPPATGAYRFQIRANKDAALFLGGDGRAGSGQRIEPETEVLLEQGRAYAIEVLHWETTGRDYVQVGWTRPDGPQQMPVPGEYLALEPWQTPAYETGFARLQPVKAETAAGDPLAITDDGRVMAPESLPPGSDYRVTVPLNMPRLTALRIEPLPGPSLPAGGPGRAPGGPFRLREIQAAVMPENSESPPQRIRFREAIVEGDPGANRLVDGQPGTFWKPLEPARPLSILLLPASPLSFDRPPRIQIALSNRDNLGCFRVSATAMADPRQPPRQAEPAADDGGTRPWPLLVNLGGGDWTDREGNRWQASRDFDGQTFGHEGGSNITSDVVVNDQLFGTQRRGLIAFRAVVPEGTYSVALLFRETATLDPARRTFTVVAEGRNVPPVPFRGPGMGANYVHKIPRLIVRDGRLDIDFFPQSDSLSMLNGIAIHRLK